MAKNNGKRKKTNHHYHCQSRCFREFSKKDDRNIVPIWEDIHVDWHWMFSNMIPLEVIHYLITFWSDEHVTFQHVHLVCKFEGRTYEFTLGEHPKILGTYAARPRQCRRRYERIFGRYRDVPVVNLYDAVIQVIEEWSPKIPGYWHKVVIHVTVYGSQRSYRITPRQRRRRRRKR